MQYVDMKYMPLFTKSTTQNFQVHELVGDARTKVLDFCSALGSQMTRDSFMDHKLLHSIGCLPSYNPFYSESIEATNNETDGLASALKGIGGVHYVNKHSKKKKRFGEGDSSKSAQEQDSVSGKPEDNNQVVDLETDRESEEALLQKEKEVEVG